MIITMAENRGRLELYETLLFQVIDDVERSHLLYSLFGLLR